MQLDPSQFLHHLEHFDMNDAQKTEYVRAVILVMQSFVDRAFGDAPAQILLGTSENKRLNRDGDSVESESEITSPFTEAAHGMAAE